MNQIFTTSTGAVLWLKPVQIKLCNKVAAHANAVKNQSDVDQANKFLDLAAELITEGVTEFKLTKEQEALVTLTRPELKKLIPGFNRNLPDFPLYVFSLAPTYEELTKLALAILEVTKNSRMPKASPGFLPFGRGKIKLALDAKLRK